MMIVTQRRFLHVAGVLAMAAAWEGVHYIVESDPDLPDVLIPSIQDVLERGLPSRAIYAEFGSNLSDLSREDSVLGGLAAIAVQSMYTLARFFSGLLCGLTLGVGLGLATTLSATA